MDWYDVYLGPGTICVIAKEIWAFWYSKVPILKVPILIPSKGNERQPELVRGAPHFHDTLFEKEGSGAGSTRETIRRL